MVTKGELVDWSPPRMEQAIPPLAGETRRRGPSTVGPLRLSSPAEWELAQIAVAQTDLRQFAPLYEMYVDLVWRYAMSRLGDPDRAADATSTIFHRAMRALPGFEPHLRGGTTSFRSWLMTIAHNVIMNEHLGSHPLASLDDPSVQRWLVDPHRGPEAQAVAGDERRLVEHALGQLPTSQRRIVELRLIGMTGREIADMLHMSESAVKTAHFRAHARLRALLADTDTLEGDGR